MSEKTIKDLQEKNWPVFLWPLNTKESIDWGISTQPYGIVTDEPILTKQLYNESKSD